MEEVLGKGADGLVVRATIVDPVLLAELQTRMKTTPKVAIKLFQHSVKMLTDAEATELDPQEDPDAAFHQEMSVMSALQGHSSIVGLVGFTEGATCGIVMKLY